MWESIKKIWSASWKEISDGWTASWQSLKTALVSFVKAIALFLKSVCQTACKAVYDAVICTGKLLFGWLIDWIKGI